MHGIVTSIQELLALQKLSRPLLYHYKKSTRPGQYMSKLRGRGMDFAEVRNYQAGDEIRHMEWRITARTGKPHIKLYQEERERPVFLLVDFNSTMFFGTKGALKSVIAARLAAIIAWTVVRQGDKIGGSLYAAEMHHDFTPRKSESSILPLLSQLSKYTELAYTPQRESAHSLSQQLMKLRRVIRPGSLIILISDFYHLGVDCEQHVSRLCAHNDVIAFHICDPIEIAPPLPNRYAMTNGTQEVLIDTREKSTQRHYQAYCQKKNETLKQWFQRSQVRYIQVTPLDDLTQIVHQTFSRKAHAY